MNRVTVDKISKIKASFSTKYTVHLSSQFDLSFNFKFEVKNYAIDHKEYKGKHKVC